MKRYLIALYVSIAVIAFSTARAFAQAAVPMPSDPLVNPAESVGLVEKLFRSGAITASIIVAAFMTLVVLRNRVAWFSEGWRAVWCSAAIGGLSMLVDAIQSGLTPNISMLIVATVTTFALAQQPKPKAPTQLPSGEVKP